jgi:hypothetical protein
LIFYFVKASDYNNNGQMDAKDPYILYVSDKNGDGLKRITPMNKNACLPTIKHNFIISFSNN